jgi:hypothetical protein
MGARRVMYWRQPANRRTMQNYLELARAVSSRLNVLDARETRWSAEVTLRRRANEPDAPGMFVSLTARDVAEEVFHVTLDASGGAGSGFVARETGDGVATAPSSSALVADRSVLVLRAERRCVEDPIEVKEYAHRCATHRLTHRAKIEGTQFWSGDFAVRVGKVENMQGTYAGAVLEFEYGPVSVPEAAEPALREFTHFATEALRDVVSGDVRGDVPDEKGTRNTADDGQSQRKENKDASEYENALVAVPDSTLAAFGLNARPFGDAAAATLYVACVMSMQS